jgi:flagellar biosynthesis protein FliR
VGAALLLSVRVFAILRAQVLWRQAVGPTWWIVAAGLSGLVVLGSADLAAGPDLAAIGVADVALELVLGTVLGIVASLPGWALVGAAAANGAVFPRARATLAGLFVALVLAVAMAAGLHHALLTAALDTAAVWPVGDARSWTAGVDARLVARAAHAMLVLALGLATPVLLVAAAVEVAMRVAGRGPAGSEPPAAAATVFVRGAGALVALGAAWQAYAMVWAEAAVGVAP